MSGVTSGRGRNGPWLQNDWLRVEARLDDGTISPVASATGFRPSERVRAYAELADGATAVFGRCDYDVQPFEDRLGRGRRITLTSRLRGLVLRREVCLYDGAPYGVTRVGIANEGRSPLRLAALHAFTADEGRGRLRLASPADRVRVYRNGWQSWAPTLSFGGREMDVRSAPPVLSPEPPTSEPGRFASDDVGVLYDADAGRSLLVGAVTARDFISQVIVDPPSRAVDARNLCDGIAVAPGEAAWSERFAFDLAGGPLDQLERYGDALGREMGARAGRTPSGWCSWYEFYTRVTEDDVVRNLRELERRRRELPVETVQIDDGYQADIGDWLTVNEKFPRGMGWLASEIKRAGFTPGIWLAPFLLAETSQSYAAHPDWVVRGDDGEPVLAIGNWERRNFGLDGSHAEARAWLTQLFREICDGWGYEYVKIDFLFGAAVAGRRHDPQATRVGAYRQALAAVREGVGPERFILGCGALMAPSVGYVDGNRIGPDVAPFWRNLTREERAAPVVRARRPDDDLSAETAIRNTLTRAWMHGRLWANDPDCLLVREHFTKLTTTEVRTLATAIGLSAGMMLSSDDLVRVPDERRAIISMLLPGLPHAGRPVDLIERDMPETVVWEAGDGSGRLVVGLFNFADAPRELAYALPEGAWHAFECWSGSYVGVVKETLRSGDVEAHGCRLVSLVPAGEDGAPAVVGTTGHISMGALDVRDERWDLAGPRLSGTLVGVGVPARRVCVAAPMPVQSVLVDGAPVAFEAADGAVLFDADVMWDTTFEVIFSGR